MTKRYKVADDYRKCCPTCGAVKPWEYSTNGDGSSVQICTRCGAVFPVGRYYQDTSVGVRVIAYSMLSALVTLKPSTE